MCFGVRIYSERFFLGFFHNQLNLKFLDFFTLAYFHCIVVYLVLYRSSQAYYFKDIPQAVILYYSGESVMFSRF